MDVSIGKSPGDEIREYFQTFADGGAEDWKRGLKILCKKLEELGKGNKKESWGCLAAVAEEVFGLSAEDLRQLMEKHCPSDPNFAGVTVRARKVSATVADDGRNEAD
jgi:hypothetical protein